MKKLVFGLIATFMLTASSFGQTVSDTSKKNIINAQMVTLVNTARTFYAKGQSYDDFVRALTIPSPTVPSQDELFRKVYGYVSAGTADCDIAKADNSVLSRFAQEMANSPKNQSTPNVVYSLDKKWWQILINVVINVGLDLLPVPHQPVDLWPDVK